MKKEITEYLKEHQLDMEVMNAWGITVNDRFLEIPIKNINGDVTFSKYRHFDGPMKYSYTKGASMELFGAHLINKDTTDIFILEGELKAILMNEQRGTIPRQGLPHKVVAVSSTGGALSFKEEWFELLKGKDIHILFDNDKQGKEGAMSLWYKLQKHPGIKSVEVLTIPEGYKDINELYESKLSVLCDTVIPTKVNFLEISSKDTKPKKLKVIRSFFQELNSYEFVVYTEQHRWFVNKAREIARMEYLANNKKPFEGVEQDASLSEVKKIPISSLITFKGGVANCVFHSDRTPSMHYNDENSAFPNTVKCYSCGKFGDVIDVVIALNNCSFKEALDILKKQ